MTTLGSTSEAQTLNVVVQNIIRFCMNTEWKSGKLFKGTEGVMCRALYKSMGFTDEDPHRPLIGVVNTWNEASPGHFHLRQVAEATKAGVWQAGGTPFEFGTFATCGGVR